MENKDHLPFNEYPRPSLRRDSFFNLCGLWDFAISKDESLPKEYHKKTLVPYSPETSLSGVSHILSKGEHSFYEKEFSLDKSFIKDKVILHFLAVDQIADVYLNDVYLGRHIGGYLPFEFEIKDYLKDNNVLVVKVIDETDNNELSRGKQKIKRGGIWYTPQSGIYYPVWIESVSNDYIKGVKLTPNIDSSELEITVNCDSPSVVIEYENKKQEIKCNILNKIKIDNMHLWSTEDPYLYNLKIKSKNDEVTSYFAMRKISKIEHNGHIYLALNNKPIFMNGVLDQGYYKDALYTPKSYEEYIKDIELVKSLGFNTIRKHIKIEMPRWYYECDKRGVLVWQDFINGGGKYHLPTISFPLITNIHHKDNNYSKFSRNDIKCRELAEEEFKDIIDYLYNHPSIILWTIFNEGWGQFDSKKIYDELKEIDKSRLFDHASGWHDQGVSDVKSMHVYFKRVKIPKEKEIHNRAVVLSEFGGYILPIKGHKQEGKPTYRSYKDKDKWLMNFKKSFNKDVINNIPLGLAASIYTQLSDVEDECNGFITFDREVIKVEPKLIKEIVEKAKI